MKAKEKLAQWYIDCEPKKRTPEDVKQGIWYMESTGIYVAPEHIDLIANLVVERLRGKE